MEYKNKYLQTALFSQIVKLVAVSRTQKGPDVGVPQIQIQRLLLHYSILSTNEVANYKIADILENLIEKKEIAGGVRYYDGCSKAEIANDPIYSALGQNLGPL